MEAPLFSNDIERDCWSQLDQATRIALGQFWTPYEIARMMAAWLAPTNGPIVDPAAGSGVFLRALSDPVRPTAVGRRVDNFDLDPVMLSAVSAYAPRLEGVQVEVGIGDGLVRLAGGQWAGVIMNPPYIKHHSISNKNEIGEALEHDSGAKFSRTMNLYTMFLVRAALSLTPGGRMAAIVPSEFLNANFGRAVKKFLLDRDLLRGIIAFDFGTSVFEDAITTACVVLLANDGPCETVSFLKIHELGQLHELEPALAADSSCLPIGIRRKVSALDPDEKWRGYFDEGDVVTDGLVKLRTFARVTRGIATGHNRFFIRKRSEINALGLDIAWFIPCIGKADLVRGDVFTQADLDRLDREDRAIWLLAVPAVDPMPHALARLLSGPDAEEAKTRYLCANRATWYQMEVRKASPMWVGVFSRGPMKIIRNGTGAVTLAAFHTMTPHLGQSDAGLLLSAYFRTRLFEREFVRQRREYGRGLVKVEPKDVEDMLVPDFRLLAPAARAEVIRSERKIQAGTAASKRVIERIEELLTASPEAAEAA